MRGLTMKCWLVEGGVFVAVRIRPMMRDQIRVRNRADWRPGGDAEP